MLHYVLNLVLEKCVAFKLMLWIVNIPYNLFAYKRNHILPIVKRWH